MELDVVKILKKITNIVIRRLPDTERKNLHNPAFIFVDDTDTLCINSHFDSWLKNIHIGDNERIWAAIITHEELHRILIGFEDSDSDTEVAYDGVDKIAPTVLKSIFFVDGDLKWLNSR